jgi:CubicO group peptidase (beta-lactamase class C family)
LNATGGLVAPGFEGVAEAFAAAANASAGGAAFAVFAGEEPLVDIWHGQDWCEDTLVLIFSGTKGLIATCVLLLVERGLLDLEEPVARYWPGFAARDVLVRHVLAHTAGLPGLQPSFSLDDALDALRMEERVAGARPLWQPGTTLAYHAFTFGWLCDGLIRHIDGRSTGRFFSDEVAGPLDLELWIGLPSALESRVAELVRAPDYALTYLGDEPEALLASVYPDSLDAFRWNEERVHQAEIPAGNAIGTARAVARLYGSLDRILRPETLELASGELSRGLCEITRRSYAFGAGFELWTELQRLGPERDAFGHTGSGGSTHGRWPSHGVGFSYAMSELRLEAADDRGPSILAALSAALRSQSWRSRARPNGSQKLRPRT